MAKLTRSDVVDIINDRLYAPEKDNDWLGDFFPDEYLVWEAIRNREMKYGVAMVIDIIAAYKKLLQEQELEKENN